MLVIALLVAMAFGGCALRKPAAQRSRVHGRRATTFMAEGKILEVPVLKGPSPHCGAYASAMVTTFLGHPCPVEELVLELHPATRGGISNRAMAAYLRRKGFECYNLNGSLDVIERLLASGIPPMLVLKARGGDDAFHYVVVVGLSKTANLIAVNNPFSGREYLTTEELEAAWSQSNHSMLVVANRAKKSTTSVKASAPSTQASAPSTQASR
jgi:ABC-type bacteriocin/lantibiotic exporter with double-glycine peptidase domain